MEWVKSRWVIAVLICILIIAAAIIIVMLLSQPHEGSYTNAWYVRYGSCQKPFGFFEASHRPVCTGLTAAGGSYII